VARLHLETRTPDEPSGTVIEINGGKIFKVEEAGLPPGTSITIRDLFFNTPARKKFLKAESTELAHIASLVTHYALAHPEKHFELHSATNAMLVAPPVSDHSQRVYQVFCNRWRASDCRSLRRGVATKSTKRRSRARCACTASSPSPKSRS